MCLAMCIKADLISPFLLFVVTFGCILNLNNCSNLDFRNLKTNADQSLEIVSTEHITETCATRCPEENRTNPEHLTVACGKDCYVKQCALGCSMWEEALNSSCQMVCNKTDDDLLEPKELYCVMGCNDALNRYFKWLRSEVGTPAAPALVADTLTATSLSLEWEVPSKLTELTKGKPYSPKSYLVQWRYEEVAGDWKFCRNQSIDDNSTVRVDNLQPYTKYRFRVALPLSPNYDEVLVSEQSVIISTIPMGVPLSEPAIVRVVAVDHTRISVSWEPGPFPNGPILSYVLQIRDLSSEGNFAIKDIPAHENINFYIFDKLFPSKNYSVLVSMRNAEGEGPPAKMVVTTPPQPPIKYDEPEPRLILGAEFSVLSQGSDILSEPPDVFYKSDHRILGIAINIAKQLIFVSDEAGFVYKAPLEKTGKKEPILFPSSGLNFIPSVLSMDWLNDHLYILGEVKHPNGQRVWQISRCGLNGRSLTIAIAGLHRRPNHIQVDPYNGYLFWIITGYTPDTGLFRLDLADISNGVKHEVQPLHMIHGQNLGAFVVDYTRFRLLIPPQNENTVISVSLDGKDREDIRKNTQSPKLNIVKSLAMANGIFYWTNGSDLFMEDHHTGEDNYYHNAYPGVMNGTFVAVCVNLPSSQPIPVPVNPPRHVQALLSATKAKISWHIPHLLGNQGKGAWQEWYYELEIIDGTSVSNVIRNIKGTYFTVDKLRPNINYTFRAAAYTIAGKGPWSTEFCGKTLKSSHERYLIWSSNEGLLQSDILGEHIRVLIPKIDLGEDDISDMAWFEDVLFFVSNSTLKFYNRTSGVLAKFNEIDSVGSIGIDWIGKRIYWSNPSQQLITRASLTGQDKESLPIIAVARELKIDSLRGHIYFSTAHAVEVCRLNGKNRMIYFSVPLYSGKQIMGLTLDMDNEKIFWIVRSYEGSSLFNAPMAKYWNKNISPIETILEERTLNGPLTHFSDRLLWLQDDHTVIVGDMNGKNLAHIRNNKLIGLKSVTIIDPTHHIYPNITNKLNVIPETILNTSIKIIGNWKNFSINWLPEKTVTYGNVFYELRIHRDNTTEIVREINTSYFQYTSDIVPPYTLLEIAIRAFTYWGYSKFTFTKLYTPSAIPSVPANPRVFITHYHDPLRRGLNISATFRWNKPIKPNGPIIGYKIFVWYKEDNVNKDVRNDFLQSQKEIIISNLVQNVTYYFQVQAFTPVGSGPKTNIIQINSNDENPIPLLLVATYDDIIEIDLDINISKSIVHTGNLITHLQHIKRENRLLWFNDNHELISYNGTKIKLLSINNEILSFTIDWIQRIVYWSELINIDESSIYSLNLNRIDNRPIVGEKLLTRYAIIKDLIVSPINQTLYWLEMDNITINTGHIIHFDFNLKYQYEINNTIFCLNGRYQHILLDTSSIGENRLILIDSIGNIFIYGIQSQICNYIKKIGINSSTEFIVKDSGYMYFMNNNIITVFNKQHIIQYTKKIDKGTQILAYYHQKYPPRRCLIPKQRISFNNYIPELIEKTENSLLLQLPEPELHNNCSYRLSGIKYEVKYSEFDKNINITLCDPLLCKIFISYESVTRILYLKAFTKYQLQIGINNYYGEQMGMKTIYGPVIILSTAPGQPSPPHNITAHSINPNEVVVHWQKPLQMNSDNIWYEIHWQTENSEARVLNRQQHLVIPEENLIKNSTDEIAVSLSKLQPEQMYNIFVQAYSTQETFSISPIVSVTTFPEPDTIILINSTATSLLIHWEACDEIVRYKILYRNIDSNDYVLAADSEYDNRPIPERNNFLIENLLPKTIYIFVVHIFYNNTNTPYVWPQDNRSKFETLGDKPSAPGQPRVYSLSTDIYKVSWLAAKENGAIISEYSLEALHMRIKNRIIRSNNFDNPLYQIPSIDNYTILQNQIQWIEEIEPIEEKWIIYYNGTDTYWIVKDIQPINDYSFRVRAKNSYGWGPYSTTSEPISERLVSNDGRNSLLIAIFLPVMVVTFCVIFTASMIFIHQRRVQQKKLLQEKKTRIPDVELANLRELPRGVNFIHTNNILYTPTPLTDADVALLPQIRRDQITMSSFLGSGAFGEVYEGCVKNVDEQEETRVAIKTLRKGATEQEKGEFLQEAQLMSNFKHEHILRLIGVCFDSDTLYIIMELMQGGDLLSYLRQSRPTMGTPSSLTLLDLISMCVDVSSGCRYLEEMHFVHRDLACRNCLVSSVDPEYRVVKIGDFGLARDIYKNDYYRKEGEGLLPVRWMSPESLVDGVFTSQSDIWAFGVLCWEIMTLGQQPYPARTNVEVLHYVRDGGRLGRPTDCPDELYQLMLKCWSYCPEDRPTFKYCLDILQLLKGSTSDAVKIVAHSTNRLVNGGIFNPSYLGSDYNHNTNSEKPNGWIGVKSQQNRIESPIIITPTSSTTSTIVPKYLELLYDENEDQQNVFSDGYEIPISTVYHHSSLTCVIGSENPNDSNDPQFYKDSTNLYRSVSSSLINNLDNYNKMNAILRVKLPQNDEIIKDANHNLGNNISTLENSLTVDNKTFYTNTTPFTDVMDKTDSAV